MHIEKNDKKDRECKEIEGKKRNREEGRGGRDRDVKKGRKRVREGCKEREKHGEGKGEGKRENMEREREKEGEMEGVGDEDREK